MKQESKQSKITGFLTLLVLCLFAVSLLLVLLTGADVYAKLSREGKAQYQRRTVAQYITTRVRQAANVSVAEFGDGDALVIGETVDGRAYVTRVYCHDGWLRELVSAGSGDFSPEDGEKVLELKDLSLSLEEELLAVTFTMADETSQNLCLYCPVQEVAP